MNQSRDIIHQLHIEGDIDTTFQAISTARGIAKWWSLDASGHSETGALINLNFGPEHKWQAQVTQLVAPTEFEIVLIEADPDWLETTVGFQLKSVQTGVDLRFYHQGWPQANDHYFISCYCWAMYLRLLKRYIEHGEFVPYGDRLKV